MPSLLIGLLMKVLTKGTVFMLETYSYRGRRPTDRVYMPSIRDRSFHFQFRLGGLPERRRQLQGWWSDVREELERLGRKRPPTADNVPVIDCKSYLYE